MKPELIYIWMGIPFCRGLAAATWSRNQPHPADFQFPITCFRAPCQPKANWYVAINIILYTFLYLMLLTKLTTSLRSLEACMNHCTSCCILWNHVFQTNMGHSIAWRFMYIALYWLNSVAWEYRIIGNLMHVNLTVWQTALPFIT